MKKVEKIELQRGDQSNNIFTKEDLINYNWKISNDNGPFCDITFQSNGEIRGADPCPHPQQKLWAFNTAGILETFQLDKTKTCTFAQFFKDNKGKWHL